MDSYLVTPPDILQNNLHSVLVVDPEQSEVDAIIEFCQKNERVFNVYIYTPNMDNAIWLAQAINASDSVIINTRTDDYKDLWLLNKVYHYGSQTLAENRRKLHSPIEYFTSQI